MELLRTKQRPVCYDGFEPSGRMHIAQGVLRVLNVNKLVKAGCEFIFWVADWFALMNNKMGGDLEKIRVVGRYFIEIWRAAGILFLVMFKEWTLRMLNSYGLLTKLITTPMSIGLS
jgi:tyrosyl-tRNA synthetase